MPASSHPPPTPIAPETAWFPLTRWLFRRLRRELDLVALTCGQAVMMAGAAFKLLLRGQLNIAHTIEHSARISMDTLGIALILVVFSAMVIALQLAKDMANQGGSEYVGALVSMTILRELAPVMTAVGMIAMVGSAFAAELSTMQITQQVDALKSFRINPVRYLVLPRLMAGTLITPMLTVITATGGILAGMLMSVMVADIGFYQYLDSVWSQTALRDVGFSLLKATVFGFVIVILSTSIGLNTTGGAKEVGQATTRAVVWSFLTVSILDYLMTTALYGSR